MKKKDGEEERGGEREDAKAHRRQSAQLTKNRPDGRGPGARRRPIGSFGQADSAALAFSQADSAALAFILIFASLFSTKWGLFWVDISASFCFTVTVLPLGLAFSQASSRPFSKSSLFTRPRKGSDRFFQAGTMSNWACFSMFFGAIGFSCQAKSSEKTYSRKAANPMPGTIRVVSGTSTECHFLWSPYLASASAASSVSVGSAADTANV